MIDYIIICGLLLLVIVLNYQIFHNNNWYVFVYEHKMWKQWEQFIKIADSFKFQYKYKGTYVFTTPDYDATIWEDGLCSIYKLNGGIIVGTFSQKQSKRMADKLMKQLKEIDEKYEQNRH